MPAVVHRGQSLVEQLPPRHVPAGLPSSLLERRPDIRQAEQSLIAANAEIGVARAAFFPQIGLPASAGGGGRCSAFSDLMVSATGFWSYGAQVTQPIFNRGALRSQLHVTESQQRQALLDYQQAIHRPFGEVSDGLIGYEQLQEVRLPREVSVKDLQESVQLSLDRYRGGVTTYLEVLIAQSSLYAAELSLSQDRANEFVSLVILYKALGGGWKL
jgi:multidrug efflux system outer membrane protein